MPSVIYGYVIQDGVYRTQKNSSDNVKMIFNLYLQGFSFDGIAQMMNKQGIAYKAEKPMWDHNIVKRILQNKKYIGNDQYPGMIAEDDFRTVQLMIISKAGNASRKRKTAADVVWKYMICGICSNTLTQVDVRNPQKEVAAMRCKVCNRDIRLKKQGVEQALVCQLNQHSQLDHMRYAPSKEVFRLERLIDRGLEQPDNPDDVIKSIMKGVTARYDCCNGEQNKYKTINRLTEMTPLHFGKTVSAIVVTENENVSVQFK